jgi:glycine/D-amino acid oxidase-like deaminating enzyme
VVIGAGITGISIATELAERGASVVVLDSGEVGHGMTAHTTAHLTALPVPDTPLSRIIHEQGIDVARQVVASCRAAVDHVAHVVSSRALMCGFERLPCWIWTESKQGVAALRKEADAAAQLDVPHVLERPDLPFPTEAALRFDNQAQIRPLCYIENLARAIQGGRARIYGSTPITSYSSGLPHKLTTKGGTVSADHLVIATHSPHDFAPDIQERLTERVTFVVAGTCEVEPPHALLYDTVEPYHYVRRVGAGRDALLVVGGEDRAFRDSDSEEPYEALSRFARERFKVQELEYRWKGSIWEPDDGLPFIGAVPRRRNVWVATGYSGNGILFGSLAALILSDLVRGEKSRFSGVYDPARGGRTTRRST